MPQQARRPRNAVKKQSPSAERPRYESPTYRGSGKSRDMWHHHRRRFGNRSRGGHQPPLQDFTDEQLHKAFATNIFGYFYLARTALRYMSAGRRPTSSLHRTPTAVTSLAKCSPSSAARRARDEGRRGWNCVGNTSGGPGTRAEREHMGPQFAHVVTSRGPLGPKRMAPNPVRWAPHEGRASHFQEE